MSIRKISASEIQEVAALLSDKDTIELLKDIRDNQITEDDLKDKKANDPIINFKGYARYDDIIEGDPEKDDEAANLNSKLRKLINMGLVLEGFHIGLGKADKKKYGDARFADVNAKIGKYVLTDEGYALLAAAEEADVKVKNSKPASGTKTKSRKRSLSKKNEEEDDDQEEVEIKEFKASQRKEQKQQEEQKENEIEAFKAAQNKELGKK